MDLIKSFLCILNFLVKGDKFWEKPCLSKKNENFKACFAKYAQQNISFQGW